MTWYTIFLIVLCSAWAMFYLVLSIFGMRDKRRAYIMLTFAWGCGLMCLLYAYQKDKRIEILEQRIELFENKTHSS